MKKFLLISPLLLLFLPYYIFAQNSLKHFNLSSIQTIEGKVSQVKVEKGYHYREFLYLELKTKNNSKSTQKIEVAPKWFVPVTFKSGDHLLVVGAKILIDDQPLIIAQHIVFKKKKIELRDDYGFPLWRGKYGGKGRGRNRRGRF